MDYKEAIGRLITSRSVAMLDELAREAMSAGLKVYTIPGSKKEIIDQVFHRFPSERETRKTVKEWAVNNDVMVSHIPLEALIFCYVFDCAVGIWSTGYPERLYNVAASVMRLVEFKTHFLWEQPKFKLLVLLCKIVNQPSNRIG